MKPLVFLSGLGVVLLFLAACTQSQHKKIKKPPEIILGGGYDESDTIEPIGLLRLPRFKTNLDTATQLTLISYKVDDSVPTRKIRISKSRILSPRSAIVNQLTFSFNDTLREGRKYEIIINVGGRTLKNIYSDFIFNKDRVYLGWSVNLESYKKNGKIIYPSKETELEW